MTSDEEVTAVMEMVIYQFMSGDSPAQWIEEMTEPGFEVEGFDAAFHRGVLTRRRDYITQLSDNLAQVIMEQIRKDLT